MIRVAYEPEVTMHRLPLLRTLLGALVVALFAFASPLAAQTIDAGMSRAQVVEQLGKPASERTTGPRTYLFYRNGCEQSCGMQDLVVLENDGVVDAIFRKAGRRYTGESSSPVAVPPRNGGRGRASGGTAATPSRARSAAPGRRRAQTEAPPTTERVALPPGTRRGGIVVGGDAGTTPAASAPARRTVRGVAGTAPTGGAQPGDTGANAARPRAQAGGDVRVPIVPRDTQLGVQPRERGKRTLPGPVTVPITPRDTQVARPDSGRRLPPPRPQQSPTRPDSATSTRPPR